MSIDQPCTPNLEIRASLIRALEALHDGDDLLAIQTLEALVNELGDHAAPQREGLRCEVCRQPARWPGELADHRRHVHGLEAA